MYKLLRFIDDDQQVTLIIFLSINVGKNNFVHNFESLKNYKFIDDT